MVHSLSERLSAVLKVKSGYPISRYCKENGYGREQLVDWIRLYDLYGEEGLMPRHKVYRQVSCEERERLVRLYLEKDVSLRTICESADISRTNLQTWIRMVRVSGYGALYKVGRRGRKPKTMKRQENQDMQLELKRLQTENLRLKAENALLKKVRALMEEEESRLRGSGSKPSKH